MSRRRNNAPVKVDTRTDEQINWERSLGDVLKKCQDLIDTRKSKYVQGGAQPVETLPSVLAQELDSVESMRENRETEINNALEPPEPPELELDMELLQREIEDCTQPENSAQQVYWILLRYFEQREKELLGKKQALLVRYAKRMERSEIQARLGDAFHGMMNATEAEITRIQVIRQTMLDRSEEVEKLVEKALTDWDDKDRDVQEKEQSDINQVIPLKTEDIRLHLRHAISCSQSSRTVTKFFKKVQWLIYSKRFEIFERSLKELDHTMAGASKAARDNFNLPQMHLAAAHVDECLEQWRQEYDIENKPTEEESQEFLYQVNKKFVVTHQAQTAAQQYVMYGSQQMYQATKHVGEKTVKQPVRGAKGAILDKNEDSDGDDDDEDTTTYLKESRWTGLVSRQPVVEERQELQSARLAYVKKIDHVLRVEAGILDSADSVYITKRLKDIVQTHNERAGGFATTSVRDTPSQEKLLAMYSLRLLRTRDFRKKIKMILNFFRSVQRTIVIDDSGYAFDVEEEANSNSNPTGTSVVATSVALEPSEGKQEEEVTNKEQARSRKTHIPQGISATIVNATSTVLPHLHYLHHIPSDYKVSKEDVLACKTIKNRDDRYESSPDGIVVRDPRGYRIMYDAALKDLDELENELMRIGTHYIECGNAATDSSVDRLAILADLYESEFTFQDMKRKIVQSYLEIYEHTFDPQERSKLAQLVTDIMALRPRLDLDMPYFSEAYAGDVVSFELYHELLQTIINHQVATDRKNIASIYNRVKNDDILGFPDEAMHDEEATFKCNEDSVEVGALEFFPSLAQLQNLHRLLDSVLGEFIHIHQPSSPLAISAIHRCLLQAALVEWKMLLQEEEFQEQQENLHGEVLASQSSLIADDPLAFELCVKEEVEDVYDREMNKKIPGLEKHKSRASGPTQKEREEMARQKERATIYSRTVMQNAFELANLRRSLMEAWYETAVLTNIYRRQAHQLGRDLNKVELDPLNFDDADQELREEEREIFLQEGDDNVPLRSERHPNFAVAEFDTILSAMDFTTPEGIAHMLTEEGLQNVRIALKVQLLQKNVLIIAIKYNQIPLDAILRAHYLTNSDDQDPLAAPSSFGDPSKTFLTSSVAIEQSNLVGISAKRSALWDELMSVRKFFLSINTVKISLRKQLLSTYNDRHGRIIKGKRRDQVDAAINTLKVDLIDQYVKDMTNIFFPEVLKVQMIRSVEDVARLASDLPDGGAPFFIATEAEKNIPTALKLQTQGTTEEKKDDVEVSVPRRNLFDSNKLDNIWFLPHYKDLLKVQVSLKDEKERRMKSTKLRTAMEILNAQHNILVFVRLQAKLGVLTNGDGEGGDNSAMENLAFEMKKMKNEVSNLTDTAQETLVCEYLSKKWRAYFDKFLLNIRGLSEDFMANNNVHAYGLSRRALKMFLENPNRDSASMTYLWYRSKAHHRQAVFVGHPYISSIHTFAIPLLHLKEADRNYFNAEGIRIDLEIEDALQEHAVYQTSQPELSIDLQLQFLQTTLRLSLVRLRFLQNMHDDPEGPNTQDQCLRFREVYHNLISSKVIMESAEGARPDEERDEEEDEDSPSSPTKRKGKSLMSARGEQIELVKIEYDKLLCRQSIETLEKLHTTLLRPIEHAPQKVNQNYMYKVQCINRFLHQLQDQGMRVRTDAGNEAYLFTEESLVEQLDNLAKALVEWGEGELSRSSSALTLMNQQLNDQLFVKEQSIKHLEYLRELDKKSLRRRINAAVTDKGFSLFFEVESLNRKVKAIEDQMKRQEVEIRENVKKEFEQLVEDLTVNQVHLKNNFKEYRQNLCNQMSQNLFQVKKEALKKVIESQNATVELKRQTLKIAKKEDETNDFKEENMMLKRMMLKLKNLYQMKSLASERTSEKKIRYLTETLDSYKKLWDAREEVEQRETTLRQHLVSTQNALSAAEMELDTIKKELQLTNRSNRQLVQWKVAKQQQIMDFEEKLKRYEKWSHIDVEKLLAELERKDSALNRLADIEEKSVRKAEFVEKKTGGEVKRLQTQLTRERKMKQEAFQKLDSLRAGHETTGDLEKQSLEIHRWREKYSVLYNKYKQLERHLNETNISVGRLSSRGGEVTGPLPDIDPNASMASDASNRPTSAPMYGKNSANEDPMRGVGTKHYRASSAGPTKPGGPAGGLAQPQRPKTTGLTRLTPMQGSTGAPLSGRGSSHGGSSLPPTSNRSSAR